MTQEREINQILDLWFSDGPTEAPDRVLAHVADRIERQSQRPAWRLDRRQHVMSSLTRLAFAAAAVLAVAVIGYNLLPASSGVGGPSVTNSPSASPATSPPPILQDGLLVGGRYRLKPFDAAASLAIDVDVPAGWRGFPKWGLIGPNGTGASGGIGIGFLLPTGLFSDPCHWDIDGNGRLLSRGDVVIGPTVDDLVAALRANAHYEASEPVEVTIGGHPATQLDLQLPADVDFATTCDVVAGQTEGTFFPFVTAEADSSNLFAQGPGNRWQVTIVDVAGTRFVVVVDDYAETPDIDRAAARAIVESLTIEP
jgi:hypothetical protein